MSVDRLHEVIRRTLRIGVESIGDGTGPATVPQWDSVGHLNLVLEIEAEFGVRFTTEEIPQLLSIRQIREALIRKGVPLQSANPEATG